MKKEAIERLRRCIDEGEIVIPSFSVPRPSGVIHLSSEGLNHDPFLKLYREGSEGAKT